MTLYQLFLQTSLWYKLVRKEMKHVLKLICLTGTLVVFLVAFGVKNPCFAQVTQPAQTGVKPQADLKAKTTECTCHKPGTDALQKAYASLEEDEWPSAIKACKEAITAIANLSKTCKCPEVIVFQKIADAYLKYAEGGNHLDGAEDPNCPYALKLYDEVLSLLSDSIPKVTSIDVKTNAKNIQEYAEEERQFVREECEESTEPAKPAQPGQTGEKPKPSGQAPPAQTKQ